MTKGERLGAIMAKIDLEIMRGKQNGTPSYEISEALKPFVKAFAENECLALVTELEKVVYITKNPNQANCNEARLIAEYAIENHKKGATNG